MRNSMSAIEKLKSIVFENRKQYGYSQQELADATSINRAMISRI